LHLKLLAPAMNSQRAPLPVRKRPPPGERPARIKSFFSFKTPDLKASAKSPNEFCVLRALIQRREERTERRYPLPRERISGSGVRRRRVRENVSAEQGRLNPNWIQHGDFYKFRKGDGYTDHRCWSRMGIVAGASERDSTGVFDSICVGVDVRMQLWRSAQHKHPQKSGGNEHSDTSTRGRAAFHCPRVSDGVPESARLFF